MRYRTWPHQLLFPSILCETRSSDIHLTFDDGPHPIATPAILDILKQCKAHVTFFLVGSNAARFPQLVKQIDAEGHAIANHGYSHQKLFLKPESFVKDELGRTTELIEGLIGKKMTYCRPPYGSFDFRTLRIARELGQRVVLWSIDSRDFEDGVFDAGYVTRRARHGSIILFHDNDATASVLKENLTSVLGTLQAKGFTFSALPHDPP